MLNKVEVRNSLGTLLTLLLNDSSSGFVVQNIDGLDPVKATLVSSSFANLSGAQFQSSKRDPRNIIFQIGFDPDYSTTSVRTLRKQLYTFFMPQAEVDLRFFDSDESVVDISGIVETFEAPLFVKQPFANISVMCFDPDFLELDPVTVSGDSVSDSTEFNINYTGDIETGFLFTLNLDRTLTEFTIYHRTSDNVTRTLDFSESLEADDILTINTVVGNKYAILLRDTVNSSILNGISPQSTWLSLKPGDNYIRVYAVGASIPFSIEYAVRHGGL